MFLDRRDAARPPAARRLQHRLRHRRVADDGRGADRELELERPGVHVARGLFEEVAELRPVEPDRIERIVNSIQRQLEASGESEIPTKAIGKMVMENLKDLDQVGYVRFASVYRNFREAKDFEDFVENLG